MGRTLWRVGRAWCGAVLFLLAISLLVILIRDGPGAASAGLDGFGGFAVFVVLSPGLLLMMIGGMLGPRQHK